MILLDQSVTRLRFITVFILAVSVIIVYGELVYRAMRFIFMLEKESLNIVNFHIIMKEKVYLD